MVAYSLNPLRYWYGTYDTCSSPRPQSLQRTFCGADPFSIWLKIEFTFTFLSYGFETYSTFMAQAFFTLTAIQILLSSTKDSRTCCPLDISCLFPNWLFLASVLSYCLSEFIVLRRRVLLSWESTEKIWCLHLKYLCLTLWSRSAKRWRQYGVWPEHASNWWGSAVNRNNIFNSYLHHNNLRIYEMINGTDICSP